MESSHEALVPSIDPYVLEFVVNFRWLLHYVTRNLDPSVEAHYPALVSDVANMESVLARTLLGDSCTLNDVPFGALRLSRESALYLLVCDHLLGGCPPTMHPFLRRAYSSTRESAAEQRGGSGAAATSNAPASNPRTGAGRRALNVDLNVSFPSGSESISRSNSADKEEEGTTAAATATGYNLDSRPVGLMGSSTGSCCGADGERPEGGREAQAALILLRWLCAEGVVAEEEIAATLNLESCASSATDEQGRRMAPQKELRAFRRHQQLARRLAELIPFYLGAHVLISRSLLLQYSSTLLTVEGVMQHVQHLEAPLVASSSRYTPYSALRPPGSVEGALLEWLQVVMDSAKEQLRTATLSTSSQMSDCRALCTFIECGPFCADTVDPSERDFFRLVQSGECVCIALWFYCPEMLPLAELSRALQEAERFMSLQLPESTLASQGEIAERFQMHQSVCYWTASFAAARALGLVPLLTPLEVVRFGRTALPLHLFVFVQQLFAVLATKAEEDVRVSADTAWWEQLGDSNTYTELTEADARARQGEGHAAFHSMDSPAPGAQHVLRQSMRGRFPPGAFDNFHARTSARGKGDKGEEGEMTMFMTEPPRGEVKTPASLRGDTSAPSAAASVLPAHFTPVLATAVESRCLPSASASSSSSSSSATTTTTHFAVQFAGTQRCKAEPLTSSNTSGVSATGMETCASALRPMVARNRGGEHRTTVTEADAERGSYSGTTFTSVTTPARLATERLAKSGALPANAESRVDFADRVVDTYARTPDAQPLSVDPASIVAEFPPRRLLSPADARPPFFSKVGGDALQAASATPADDTALRTSAVAPGKSKILPLDDQLALRGVVTEGDHTSSPKLPKPRVTSAKPRAVFSSLPTPAALIEAVAESSASSFSYSTDFVVQSVPRDDETSHAEATAVAVEKSASFSKPGALLPQLAGSDVAVTALPPSPTRLSAAEEEEEEAEEKKLTTLLSSSTVAIRRFNYTAEDADSSGSRDGDAKASSLTTHSTLSSKAAPSFLSNAPLTPPKEKQKHPPTPSSSISEGRPTVVAAVPKGTAHRQQSSVLDSSAPTRALTAPAHTPGSGLYLPHSSSIRPPALDTTAASPLSPHTSTFTDIAVEDDGTFAVNEADAPGSVRESFPTPTEREEANRHHGETSGGSADTPSTSQRTSVRNSGTVSHGHAWLPGALSPPPAQPHETNPLEPAGVSDQTASSHHTMSDGSNVDGLSPLTPALTQSASEVFGTDYASLLEGAASSYASPGHHRRPRAYDDDSWFSSVSQVNRQSIQSTAESMMSVRSVRESAQVRELLERLRGMAVADLEQREKAELRDALARQQEVVAQLTHALQQHRGGRGAAAVRAFPAGARPSVRRRQVHLRSPSEEVSHASLLVPVQGQGADRSLLKDLSSPGTATAERNGQRQRRRSVSAMTLESRASPSQSLQSDGGAQLAELDRSSLLANILMPEKSTSPARAIRR